MAYIELIEDDPPVRARTPIPIPIRRPRPEAAERTARVAVGGNVVSSMKRGMKRDERNWRLVVLVIAAAALLLLLNWTWLSRIHTRVRSVGGWSAVKDKAARWASDALRPVELASGGVAGASRAVRDEM